jgi:hypothetical protein
LLGQPTDSTSSVSTRLLASVLEFRLPSTNEELREESKRRVVAEGVLNVRLRAREELKRRVAAKGVLDVRL